MAVTVKRDGDGGMERMSLAEAEAELLVAREQADDPFGAPEDRAYWAAYGDACERYIAALGEGGAE